MNARPERTPDTEELQEPAATPSALETKLAVVLDMRITGRSQAEIAHHFGVSERTVRRWEREAERRKISPLRDRDPFEFTREGLSDLAEFRADWLALYRKARDAGDHDSMAKCQKILTEIRREQDRVFALGSRTKKEDDPLIEVLRLSAERMKLQASPEKLERMRQEGRAIRERREAARASNSRP